MPQTTFFTAATPDYENAVEWTFSRLLSFMEATRTLVDDHEPGPLIDLYNTTLDDLTPIAERLKP